MATLSWQRVLIWAGALVLVGLALWWPGREAGRSQTGSGRSESAGPIQTSGTSRLVTFTITPDGIVGLTADGAVTLNRFDGSNQVLGTAPLPNDGQVVLNSKGSAVAVQERIDDQRVWRVYDVASGQRRGELPQNAGQLTWAPPGDRLLYDYTLSDGTHNLSISTPDGRDWKALRGIPTAALTLIWLPNQTHVLSLHTQTSGPLRQYALSTGTSSELVTDALGVSVAPAGGWVLIRRGPGVGSVGTESLSLGQLTADGIGPLANLPSEETSLDRFAWSADGQSLYTLQNGALQRVVLATGAIEEVTGPLNLSEQLIDAEQLLLANDQAIFVVLNGRLTLVQLSTR